ncbi:MAG: MarR family winged helix-turn-helix transcriptional regulator [Acidimicrobiales bacterium]
MTREGLNAEQLRAWHSFLRASVRLLDRLDADLTPHGLSLADYEILAHLSAAPDGLRMSELSDQVLVSRSGLTRRVERLETEGFVRRDRCATDRRGVLAVLTTAGRQLLEAAAPTHVEGVRRHFAETVGPRVAVLGDALADVADSAERPDQTSRTGDAQGRYSALRVPSSAT